MAIGTPSTPTHQQKFTTPSAPKRKNPTIDNIQQNSAIFLASPPRSISQPVFTSPIHSAKRVPFLQLSTNHIDTVSTTGMNQKFTRFSNSISETSTNNKSNWNWIPSELKLRFQECRNTSTPTTQFIGAIQVFYDSEPMETEATFGEFGNKHYVTDSMEIDIEDDSMEVDSIVDTETLMDYISSH